MTRHDTYTTHRYAHELIASYYTDLERIVELDFYEDGISQISTTKDVTSLLSCVAERPLRTDSTPPKTAMGELAIAYAAQRNLLPTLEISTSDLNSLCGAAELFIIQALIFARRGWHKEYGPTIPIIDTNGIPIALYKRHGIHAQLAIRDIPIENSEAIIASGTWFFGAHGTALGGSRILAESQATKNPALRVLQLDKRVSSDEVRLDRPSLWALPEGDVAEVLPDFPEIYKYKFQFSPWHTARTTCGIEEMGIAEIRNEVDELLTKA